MTHAITPDDTVLSTKAPICVSFDNSNAIEQQGVKASVDIPQAIFALLQLESTVTINGVTFTYSDAANAVTNELLYSGDAATDYAALVTALGNNYGIVEEMTVTDEGTTITIESKNCVDDIEVSFNNLTGVPGYQDYLGQATPSKVRDGYHVKFSLKPGSECKREIRVTPKPESDCEVCTSTLTPDRFKVTINGLIQFPESTFPEAEDFGGAVTDLQTGLTMAYTESYNNNIVGSYAIAGKSASPLDDPETLRIVSLYEDNHCVSHCQRVLIYVNRGTNEAEAYTMVFRFYDKSGSSILTDLSPAGAGRISYYDISLDRLQLLFDFTNAVKNSIGSYQVLIAEGAIGSVDPGTVYLDSITFTVNHAKCSNDIMFKTSEGVYQSIPVSCPDVHTLSETREFIRTCEPCKSGSEIMLTCCDNTLDIFTNFLDDCFYNSKQIQELFDSKDVRACIDGVWFAVLPISDTVDLINNNQRGVSREFNFRIFEYEAP